MTDYSEVQKERLKVVCPDNMVFPVNPETYESEACSYYDPYWQLDPESDTKYISHSEWNSKLNSLGYKKGGLPYVS